MVRTYKSDCWLMAWPWIWMVRQLGLDQSHILVCMVRWLATRTVMYPEWDRANWAFFCIEE